MARTAAAVIKIALAEVGYKEKASKANLTSKTANAGSGNFTKYWTDLDAVDRFYNYPKQGFEWCDGFNDWCHVKAFGVDGALYTLCQPEESAGAGCPYSYNYYKAKGRVGTAPKLGAQAFFQQKGSIVHTGVVVAFDSSTVTIVEGNASNQVKKNVYKRTDSYIYGYGYPRYDEEGDVADLEVEEKEPEEKYGKELTIKVNLLKSGHKGPQVKTVQRLLYARGIKVNGKAIAVDGDFGANTKAATITLQKQLFPNNSAEWDGAWGEKTWTAALTALW